MLKHSDTGTICSELKSRIIAEIGRGAINDRLMPERKMAEAYNISRQTVSKVMMELEKEGYVSRRVGRGTFIAPHDKRVIQDAAIKPRTCGDVIIAYHDYFSYYIWESVHHAELLALKNNINLVNVKLQQESTLQSVVRIVENTSNPLGIILMTHGDNIPTQIMRQLDAYNIPVVFSGDHAPSGAYANVYSVTRDHYKSGYLKMDYLIRKGHTRIGLINNEPYSIPGSEHIKGIKQALYDNGMRWKDIIQTERRAQLWDDATDAGYALTKDILAENDLSALLYETIGGAFGGLRALAEAGKRCPEDISIVTALSLMNLERMMIPALSSVNINAQDVIKTTFDVILSPEGRLTRKHIVDVKLIERESVRDMHANPQNK